MAFVQDGVPPHKAKATQTWCETNLPNFIEKAEWPVNSPDVNPIESHWSIIDEFTYRLLKLCLEIVYITVQNCWYSLMHISHENQNLF